MLEGRAEVQRIYEGMASRGIVEHVGERHLGLFRAVRYPEKDHAPEAALLEKIRAALSGPPSNLEVPDTSTDAGTAVAGTADAGSSDARTADAGPAEAAATESTKPGDGATAAKPGSEAPDARTTALIALLQASGLLVKLFPEADLTRANELSWDYWPTRAVEDELRMIRIAEQEAANL